MDAELARLAAEPEMRKEYYALWDVQRKYAFWQADDEPPATSAGPKARPPVIQPSCNPTARIRGAQLSRNAWSAHGHKPCLLLHMHMGNAADDCLPCMCTATSGIALHEMYGLIDVAHAFRLLLTPVYVCVQGRQPSAAAPGPVQRTPQDIIAEALREAQEEASAKKARSLPHLKIVISTATDSHGAGGSLCPGGAVPARPQCIDCAPDWQAPLFLLLFLTSSLAHMFAHPFPCRQG